MAAQRTVAAVLSFLLTIFCGSAWANGRPGTEKVIAHVEEGRRITEADVRALGADRLRDYDAFTLLRLPSQALAGLSKVTARTGISFNVMAEWDTVVLRDSIIDTRVSQSPTVDDLSSYPSDPGLYIIQYDGPLLAEWEDALNSAGLHPIGYIPYNAELVVGSKAAVHRLAQMPYVQWVSVLQPAYRAQPKELPTAAAEMIVQFAATDETRPRVSQFIDSHFVKQAVSYLAYTNVRTTLAALEVRQLLRDPLVIGIELPGIEFFSGEREAISIATATQSPTLVYQWAGQPYRPTSANSYRTWLPASVRTAAANYRIALADSGLDNGSCPDTVNPRHPDLLKSTIYTDYWSNSGWCDNALTLSYAADRFGHGTMVAGIAVGDPSGGPTDARSSPTQYFNFGMGYSPTSPLYVQKVMSDGGVLTTATSIIDWARDARNNGAAVQNHSHNTYFGAAGAYTTEAQQYDTVVRNATGGTPELALPITVSAGNICGGSPSNPDCSTMVLSPATAKNVITVGAAESYRPGITSCNGGFSRQPGDFYAQSFQNVAFVSRRGTSDGRIKPDILAPATLVGSTRSQYNLSGGSSSPFCYQVNSLYNIDTGTSFAAPQAAGAVALLDAKRNTRLSPAMLKATLVGTAQTMNAGVDRYNALTGGFPTVVTYRPNITQGWGRLYLPDFLNDVRRYRLLDESSFSPFTAAGQQRGGSFGVADLNAPVILVLVWTDEPGSMPGGVSLVRDLDFDAYPWNDGCTRYTGNYMQYEQSIPQNICQGVIRTYDNRNNVETIVIQPNGVTTFSYAVTVRTWGFGSHNQPFAIFASNVL